MNWVGIELKDSESDLNWNWIELKNPEFNSNWNWIELKEMNWSEPCPHHTIPFIIIRSPHFYFLWVGVGGFPKVVATFNHVGRFFNLFMATTGDVWLTPSFRIVLHVEHISCVITNCGQHQWVTPSPLSIVLQALLEENTTRELSLSLDFSFKIVLFQVTVLIFFSIAIFSPYFLPVDLLLQYVALFQPGN